VHTPQKAFCVTSTLHLEMPIRPQAPASTLWLALVELPGIVAATTLFAFVFGSEPYSATLHGLWVALTAVGVLAAGALLNLYRLFRDDVAGVDLALPVIAVGAVGGATLLASNGSYAWIDLAFGLAIGCFMGLVNALVVDDDGPVGLGEAEQAELERRDLERHLDVRRDFPDRTIF
jgi:hypothetical protein